MRKMRIWLIVLLGVLSFSSCQEKTSQAEEEYRSRLKVVLDGHDELMKEMSTIGALIEKIETQKEKNTDTIALYKAGEQLKAAHEHMFDWMHDFSEDFDDIHDNAEKQFSDQEFEEKTTMLKKHEERLSTLEQEFKMGIIDAKKILNDSK